jgi:hypothetical protein
LAKYLFDLYEYTGAPEAKELSEEILKAIETDVMPTDFERRVNTCFCRHAPNFVGQTLPEGRLKGAYLLAHSGLTLAAERNDKVMEDLACDLIMAVVCKRSHREIDALVIRLGRHDKEWLEQASPEVAT